MGGRVALLVMVLLASGWGAAVNPLDDDAGSGGDAGDVPELALLITLPSVFDGRLFPSADVFDYYAFHARGGTHLEFRIEGHDALVLELFRSDGTPYQAAFAHGDPMAMYLDRDDRWVIKVSGPLIPELPFPYRVSVMSLPAMAVLNTLPQERWSGFEVELDEPTQGYLTGRVAFGFNATNEGGAQLMAQYSLRDRTGTLHEGTTGIGLLSFATGDRIIVQPTPLPSLEIPAAVTIDVVGGWAQLEFRTPGEATGKIRILVYRSDAADAARLTFVGDAPFASRQWSGNGLETWSEADGDGAFHVMAPGLSIVGERTRDLNVEGTFVGLFFVWDQEGWIEDPGGCRTHLADYAFEFLVRPREGRWQLHVDASVGTDHRAARLNLFGAFVPIPFEEFELDTRC